MVNGTGNGLANTITGNSGANIIEGKAGADILDGGVGLDTVSYASSVTGVAVVLNGAIVTFGTGGDAQGDSIKNSQDVMGCARPDGADGQWPGQHAGWRSRGDGLNGGRATTPMWWMMRVTR